MIAGVLVVILSVGAFFVLKPAVEPARTMRAFSDFLLDVQDGRVRHITQAQDLLEFERLDGSRFETIAPQGYVASNPTSSVTSRSAASSSTSRLQRHPRRHLRRHGVWSAPASVSRAWCCSGR
jgi:hypothetical protein